MDLRNLLLRVALGAFCSILSLLICLIPIPRKLADLQRSSFDLIFLTVFALSRIFLFFFAFFLLHQKPHGDLVAFYLPEAHKVLHGLVPYRDFQSSYAPLNPYLDALLLRIHNSPLSIVVFQIACDIASIPFWIGFLRRFLAENTLRRSALLYLVQPLLLWGTAIDGKNHACISLLLAITLFALARKEIVSGIAYSLSIVVVKILPLMFLPTLFLGSRKRLKWALSALSLTLLVYLGFVLYGADVTVPLRFEGSLATSGDLPYFWAYLSGHSIPGIVSGAVTLLGVGVAVVFLSWAQIRVPSGPGRSRILSDGILLLLITLLLLSKKSDPIYLTMCLFPLCAFTSMQMETGRRWMAYPYAMLTFLGLPISSFFFWPLRHADGVRLHEMLLGGSRNAWLMAIAQPLLLASYAVFIVRICQELLHLSHSARPHSRLSADPAEQALGNS
ncbi:MAG TPA: hypothetical protein VME86_03065 [Acidobacteriaceae bacterium]|nr:hypothetical protein [Acidobacteriaceae bacterium]